MSDATPIDIWKRYEKQRVLGSGSFGKVYLVRERGEDGAATGESLVVKQTVLGEAASAQLMEANATEVYVLGVLQHPNIVRYVAHFVDTDSAINLVTEYCDAGDLQQFIDSQTTPTPLPEALSITFQLLVGVRYMHLSQVMHRDLKPSNVFLSSGLRVKIGDFGISKMLSSHSLASTMVGTPYYLSPEVCSGSEYTHPADMWSLGCVVYELFARSRPFTGGNILAIAQAISSGRYPPLPEHVDARVAALIADVITVNPAERATAEQLLATYFDFSSPLPPKVRQDVYDDLRRRRWC